MFKFIVSRAPGTPTTLGSRPSTAAFFAPPGRLDGSGSRVGLAALLDLLGRLLGEVLHLRGELAGELDILRIVLADTVNRDPVIPSGFPALVVDFVLVAFAILGAGHVEDLGLVEHFMVEA